MSADITEVGVIGAGFVGLSLAAHLLKNTSSNVVLIESNETIVSNLRDGIVHVYEPELEDILCSALQTSRLTVLNRLPNMEFFAIFICIGTPKQSLENPIARYAVDNYGALGLTSLIFIRSTVEVGTTDSINAQFSLGTETKFHACPERTVEGNAIQEIANLPQLLGSGDKISAAKAVSALKMLGFNYIIAGSPREVETAKLVCNVWRDYTFAFSNELARLSQHFNVNPFRVIEIATNQYSRAPIPRPGPVGGPCLTKDTYILTQNLSSKTLYSKARETNELLEKLILDECQNIIKKRDVGVVLIAGVAFKGSPLTNDYRESVALKILDSLREQDIEIVYWDPLIKLESYRRVESDLEILSLLDQNCLLVITNDSIKLGKRLELVSSFLNSKDSKLFVYDLVGAFQNISSREKVIALGETLLDG